MRFLAGLLVATAVAGCIVGDEEEDLAGGNGKADGSNTCELPQYGDGTCHIDLACDVPDIDCFVMFDTDAAAATWVGNIRGPAIAETDPRFVKGRKLLDAAWDFYKTHSLLGKLAEKRISLVVVENDTSNAFIMPDPDGMRGGHVVTIHSKALDGSESDLELTGVLFHELQHLSGLHWLPDIEERTNRFYLAPPGIEPIGARQAPNARLKTVIEPWRKIAWTISPYADEALGGLSFSGDLHELFRSTLGYTTECATENAAITSLYTKLDASISVVDDSLTIDAAMATEIASATTALQTCYRAKTSMTLMGVAQAVGWGEWLTGELQGDAAFGAMPAMDGLVALVADRRAKLRAIGTQVQQELSRPLSAVRYFSYEEQADDTSVAMLERAQMDAKLAANSFLGYLGDKRDQCVAAHLAGSVGYGVYLNDPHHGTCWRYAHHLQLATTPDTMARSADTPIVEAREPRIPRPAPVRRPIY